MTKDVVGKGHVRLIAAQSANKVLCSLCSCVDESYWFKWSDSFKVYGSVTWLLTGCQRFELLSIGYPPVGLEFVL